MSKFLKLVEENRPGEDRYTVELKDVNGELIDSFEMWGTGSPFDNFDTFKREFGAPIPAEDAEKGAKTGPDVTSEVGAIAAIAGLPDQGAIGGTFTKTGRRLKKAKQTMASAAMKIADKLDKAAGK